MSAPRIRHDRAWRGYVDGQSVVSTCSDCPLAWQYLAFSEEGARAAGERHLQDVHDVAASDAGAARRMADARRG